MKQMPRLDITLRTRAARRGANCAPTNKLNIDVTGPCTEDRGWRGGPHMHPPGRIRHKHGDTSPPANQSPPCDVRALHGQAEPSRAESSQDRLLLRERHQRVNVSIPTTPHRSAVHCQRLVPRPSEVQMCSIWEWGEAHQYLAVWLKRSL